jgi:hypothetical protein
MKKEKSVEVDKKLFNAEVMLRKSLLEGESVETIRSPDCSLTQIGQSPEFSFNGGLALI